MERRAALRFASALTIAAVTAGLMLRLPHRQYPRSSASAPLAVTEPSPTWKIAYVVSTPKADKSDIWTVNADGTDNRCVLRDARTPCWSADRQQLAFERGGNVWVAANDGSRQRQITFWPGSAVDENGDSLHLYGLSWNDEAHLLSFSRKEHFGLTYPMGWKDSQWETTVFHASLLTGEKTEGRPFVESVYGKPTPWDNDCLFPREPYIHEFGMTERGSRFQFIENKWPAWAPSGNRLAFVRNGDIWLAVHDVAKDKSEQWPFWDVHRLVACADFDDSLNGESERSMAAVHIAWVPDESSLVYDMRPVKGMGASRLYRVNLKAAPDGSHRIVADTPEPLALGDAQTPSVSPDGKWLLYTRAGAVLASTAEGTHERLIVRGDASEPVW